jgi:hypothetical protein
MRERAVANSTRKSSNLCVGLSWEKKTCTFLPGGTKKHRISVYLTAPFYANANRERDYLLLWCIFITLCSAHFWVLRAKNIPPPSMANMNYEQWVH